MSGRLRKFLQRRLALSGTLGVQHFQFFCVDRILPGFVLGGNGCFIIGFPFGSGCRGVFLSLFLGSLSIGNRFLLRFFRFGEGFCLHVFCVSNHFINVHVRRGRDTVTFHGVAVGCEECHHAGAIHGPRVGLFEEISIGTHGPLAVHINNNRRDLSANLRRFIRGPKQVLAVRCERREKDGSHGREHKLAIDIHAGYFRVGGAHHISDMFAIAAEN